MVKTRPQNWPSALGFLIPLITLAAGMFAVRNVDARNSGALGLIQAMPVPYFVIVGALGISFILFLRRNASAYVLGAHIAVLVFLLHGIASFIEGIPRFATAYTHVGFIDYIVGHNAVNTALDARMSWPGFFSAAALLSNVAGVSSFTFLLWAPLVMNLIYAPLVWSIGNSVTSDRRIPWLATYLFFSTSWVGQDYFAPQAANFVIFLTFVAVLLHFFRTDHAPYHRLLDRPLRIASRVIAGIVRRDIKPGGKALLPVDAQQRGLIVAALLVMFAGSIVSHQLTPVFLIINITLLVILNRTKLTGLPLLMAIGVFTWISYGAIGYWSGHLEQLFGTGAPGGGVSEGVSERAGAVKSNHVWVLYGRMGLAALLWGTAIFGILRRLRGGMSDVSLAVCFLGPFAIIGSGQSYGGESILRVFLFSLPFAATLTALALLPKGNPLTWFKTTISCLMIVVLIPTFFIARYGNERFEYISPDEFAAVNELFAVAPVGASLGAFDANLPWQIRTKDTYDFHSKLPVDNVLGPDGIYEQMVKRKGAESYVFLSRGQVESVSFAKGIPRSWGEQVSAEMISSGRFKLIYENRDARIFQVVK